MRWEARTILLSERGHDGVGPDQVPDPTRDYMVQTWVVGRHTIKTQINPSPRKRHPYFVSSFEKVPGTIAGHGLGYVPGIKDDPRVVRLAEEFRISSLTTAGNEIFSAALGELLPVVTKALNSLPAEAETVSSEGHKSTTEEVEIEVETDLSSLESHLEKEEEEKRMVHNGKT